MRSSSLLTLTLVLPAALAGCATAPAAAPGCEPVVISMQNFICLECGPILVKRATAEPGVCGARFDEKLLELTVDVKPGTSPQAIIDALKKEPLDDREVVAILGPGQGKFAPFHELEATWDAELLSKNGEDVQSFKPTPGRVTVVDFFAEWCGPCHEFDDFMYKMLVKNPAKLAYRRLNVVDWDSPLAKHYLTNAAELPYLIIIDAQGKEVARLAGFKSKDVRAAIEKAQGQP